MKIFYIPFTLLFSCSPLFSLGQAGSLDNSFGNNGQVISGIGSFDDWGQSVAIQSDGKIVMAGYTAPALKRHALALVRYESNGALDQTFGKNGVAVVNFAGTVMPSAVAIQGDGKMLVAGFIAGNFTVLRFTASGLIDSTFGINGMTITYFSHGFGVPSSIMLLNNGKIIVSGTSYTGRKRWASICFVRYNTDGATDTIVIPKLKANCIALSTAMQKDGGILVTGQQILGTAIDYFIARFYKNLDRDTAFGKNGLVSIPFADYTFLPGSFYSFCVQPDNKILIPFAVFNKSNKDGEFAILRYTSSGKMDSSFGVTGYSAADLSTTDYAYPKAIFMQTNGKIVVAGYRGNNYVLAGFDTTGMEDTAFGIAGIATARAGYSDYCTNAAIENNGSMILAGYSSKITNYDFELQAWKPDGTLDKVFNGNGMVTTPIQVAYASANTVSLESDGKLLVSGIYRNISSDHLAFWKLNPIGTFDSTFGMNGMVTSDRFGDANSNPLNSAPLVLQANGKIIVAKTFSDTGYIGGLPPIVRFNSDGSYDSAFFQRSRQLLPSFEGFPSLFSMTTLPDGKFVVAGFIYRDQTTDVNNYLLIRYNNDGSLGTSFSDKGVETFHLTPSDIFSGCSLLSQPDGKMIIMGGLSDSADQHWRLELIRVDGDGSLDNSFGISGVVTTVMNDLPISAVLQTDGKILTASNSNTFGKTSLARYNTDGTLDRTFGSNGIDTVQFTKYGCHITSAAISPDFKIFLTGNNNNNLLVIKLKSNGTLDSSFGTEGVILPVFDTINQSSTGNDILVQPDGRILVGGAVTINNNPFAIIIRLLNDLALGIINFSSPANTDLVYPNPIRQTATLKYTLSESENITISLFNIHGKLVQTFISNQNQPKGNYSEQLNFNPSLSAGNYFLTVGNSKQKETVKIMKQ